MTVVAVRTQGPAGGPGRDRAPEAPLRSVTPAAALRRRCACAGQGSGECDRCRAEGPTLSRRAIGPRTHSVAPPVVHEVLRRPGVALDGPTRSLMESRLRRDLGRIRIHADEVAARASHAVGALAWTIGPHIAFGAQRFRTDTEAGLELLAHELAHATQQAFSAPSSEDDISIGDENDPAEAHADAVARAAMRGEGLGGSPAPATPMALRRQTRELQQRGGPPQLAALELPPRGEDQVRMHVFRYLCDCQGRDVTRTRLRADFNPPGVVFHFCRGDVSGEIRGQLRPSSLTTGRATVTGVVNVAPSASGPGVRVEVEGEARNTGTEPQVGGSARVGVGRLGGPTVFAEGGALYGTETGGVESRVGGGVRLPGGTVLTGEVTNPGQRDQGFRFGLSGTLPGSEVSEERCRECVCPTAYDCIEDIPPRSYEEEVPHEVQDMTRLRHYFRLNSTEDTRNPDLRAQSRQMVANLSRLLSEGWSISAVNGYASPEAEEARVNVPLSEARARRLHEILTSQLPSGTALPEPQGRSELLGARASILPGATLGDAIVGAGFTSPEEASQLLVGEEILNEDLAGQFLDLFGRLPEDRDRLALFGGDASSPLAPRLRAAIDQFIARRGRGPRPWEEIFAYLRFANVEVTRTRAETRTETRTTQGSVRGIGEAVCRSFAERAERESRFGPAERPPDANACPRGAPRNPERFAALCHYDG